MKQSTAHRLFSVLNFGSRLNLGSALQIGKISSPFKFSKFFSFFRLNRSTTANSISSTCSDGIECTICINVKPDTDFITPTVGTGSLFSSISRFLAIFRTEDIYENCGADSPLHFGYKEFFDKLVKMKIF